MWTLFYYDVIVEPMVDGAFNIYCMVDNWREGGELQLATLFGAFGQTAPISVIHSKFQIIVGSIWSIIVPASITVMGLVRLFTKDILFNYIDEVAFLLNRISNRSVLSLKLWHPIKIRLEQCFFR